MTKSPGRFSSWRSLGALSLAFFAGSIALSLLPTPETSFHALAQLVDQPLDSPGEFAQADVAQLGNRANLRQVAYFASETPTGDSC